MLLRRDCALRANEPVPVFSGKLAKPLKRSRPRRHEGAVVLSALFVQSALAFSIQRTSLPDKGATQVSQRVASDVKLGGAWDEFWDWVLGGGEPAQPTPPPPPPPPPSEEGGGW